MQPDVGPALQVRLGRHPHDGPGVPIRIIPEIMFLAVAENDEMNAEGLGVFAGLILGRIGIDGKAFGLDDGEGSGAGILQ